MKKLFLIAGFLLSVHCLFAQQKPTELDKSPLDVSYFPANFPILKMKSQVGAAPLARVLYSRPQKKGRNIFGEEVKYNEIWRMGANEASEFELFKDARIGGKKLAKGRYSIFCIPTESKWTIIFNKDNFSWGSYSYQPDKDVARIEVPVKKAEEPIEALTMYFENNNWNIMWDGLKVEVPISF
jgi:hypothetical protein